jgi:hypothetical protein
MIFLTIVDAVVTGVVSIPVDLYYGGRRTVEDIGLLGADARLENAGERERLGRLIGEALRNRNILTHLVEIILDAFFDQVPDSVLQNMASAAGAGAVRFTARTATKIFLINLISRKIVERAITRAVARQIAKFGVGVALKGVLLQALIERASNAAHRLRCDYPTVYKRLRTENLDMLYFIVEDYMEPYLEAIKLADTNPVEFRRLLHTIQSRLK